MLREIKPSRQIKGEPRRRWFTSSSIDLFVWLNEDESPAGFQLCYDKQHREHALTWTEGVGFSHMAVDAGESRPARHKGTPILVSAGAIDTSRILDEFRREARAVPRELAQMVEGKLQSLGGPKPVAEFMRYTAPDAEAHARGISELRQKLDHAISAKDKLAVVDHAADLASMLTTDRREREALILLGEHATHAEALPGEEPSGWFWNAYATALQYAGNRTEADVYFAKAYGLASTNGWSRLEALVLHHWGRNLAEQQRFPEAESRFSAALAIRVRINDPRQESSRRALEILAELRRQPQTG